jgi:FG-GAP repeat
MRPRLPEPRYSAQIYVGTTSDSRYHDASSMFFRTRLQLILPLILANMACNDHSPAKIELAPTIATLPPQMSLVTTSETKIVPPNGKPSDLFGFSVALSGDILVAGTPYEDSQALDSGAAYVFVRNNGVWTFEQKLISPDFGPGLWFGYSVAIDGDTLIVGAPKANGQFLGTGAAYVFIRTNGSWSPLPKIAPADGKAGDMFGQAVDIAGNSLLVGTPQSDTKGIDAGAAYVFVWNGTTYVEQKKIFPSDSKAGDHFGAAVAMSGETAVIGAPDADVFGPDSGSAYAFFRQGNLWSQQKKFIGSNGAAGDGFGWSVDIDQDTAVIGSPKDDSTNLDAGAAYVFERTGITWNSAGSLTSLGSAADDRFGSSVAISGSLIVVGALLDDTADMNAGAAYLFSHQGSAFSQNLEVLASDAADGDAFGFAVAISGQTAIVSAYLDDDLGTSSGAAYIYELLRDAGEPCVNGTDCSSGFCADGFCCNLACDLGACDSCSKAGGAPENGVCTLVDGAMCDDGDGCTEVDTCLAGKCIGAYPKMCAANATCAGSSVCDPATGMCVGDLTPNGTSCNDGNACTTGEQCQNGKCQNAELVQCPPPEACHAEGTCNPSNGTCSSPVLPDGTICPDGICQNGVCIYKPRTVVITGGGCLCTFGAEENTAANFWSLAMLGAAWTLRRSLRHKRPAGQSIEPRK